MMKLARLRAFSFSPLQPYNFVFLRSETRKTLIPFESPAIASPGAEDEVDLMWYFAIGRTCFKTGS